MTKAEVIKTLDAIGRQPGNKLKAWAAGELAHAVRSDKYRGGVVSYLDRKLEVEEGLDEWPRVSLDDYSPLVSMGWEDLDSFFQAWEAFGGEPYHITSFIQCLRDAGTWYARDIVDTLQIVEAE